MTSANPFENNGALGTAVADPEPEPQLAPPPLDPEPIEVVEAELEPEPEKVAKSTTTRKPKTPSQVQPDPIENDVDVDLDGENEPEDDEDDSGDDESSDTEASSEIEAWEPPAFPSREEQWDHETIEFAGHTLNIRVPTSQALTGFTMATGQYIPDYIKQAMVSKFVQLHFSPQSYAFLMTELMNPNADGFDEESFGEVVRMVVQKGGERVVAAAEAKAALEKKKTKRGKRG